ncbi:hypothetical protein POX_g08737 [Penicillium oxalicum]|uniref:SH3 domain-containing protein n=1 Tax=Penicillium oxalicum (strain 114-2 / CGMCC 5302) TaxID=933388 RepID=S7Z8Q0_PENO1|nr:hypothetical protein POX_g08737 [Penicillium oxalicum]EPS26965.1 hypothetical protein PDE_01905 [Penicillium oxalicum 114-2]KAI2786353.1 hypothetical protein POX_g08737 [Penicillium oxalicum]
MASEFQSAMTIRSLRILKNELEFLADSSVIQRDQLNAILAQLPTETDARAAAARQNQTTPSPLSVQPLPLPIRAQPPPAPYSPPVSQPSSLPMHEKAPAYGQYATPPPVAPPAYPQAPPSLGFATALWAYTPTDAGDLALAQNDRIVVLEHMNDDWWRGRNERTGKEGIFPKSYVKPLDEKAGIYSPPPPTNYGNMPLAVAQSGSNPASNDPEQKSKFEENGKKFGKKLGNAAIFGAGATVGSNIVNSIF